MRFEKAAIITAHNIKTTATVPIHHHHHHRTTTGNSNSTERHTHTHTYIYDSDVVRRRHFCRCLSNEPNVNGEPNVKWNLNIAVFLHTNFSMESLDMRPNGKTYGLLLIETRRKTRHENCLTAIYESP